MNRASLLTRVAAMVAAIALLLAAPAAAFAANAAVAGPDAPAGAAAEATPIDLSGASDGGAAQVPGGGGSIVRTIVGLAIVIGVIYGVAWVLRTFRQRRQPQATGSGLAPLASVPLGAGRSVNLVRAGTDLVLLGVAENGVVPIRTYTQEEARAAGLVDDDGLLILPAEETAAPRERRPLPRLALPAALTAKAATPRPRPSQRALGPGPAPRNAIEQLKAWTVRG